MTIRYLILAIIGIFLLSLVIAEERETTIQTSVTVINKSDTIEKLYPDSNYSISKSSDKISIVDKF